MASGDLPKQPKYMTYSKCRLPFLGGLVDYVDSSFEYFLRRQFVKSEKLTAKNSRSKLTATFLAALCFVIGFVANVKLEVVTFDEKPLKNDLHFMLMSKVEDLYIDDIDVSRVLWCIEASDCVVLLISCLLVWNCSNVRSPLSEYLILPWLGMTLRGLFLRQVPTVGALIYTNLVVDGRVNPLFVTTFSFLFLIESRLCLEIGRVVRARWERRNHGAGVGAGVDVATPYEVETLWSNDDVRSIEVRNYIY